MKEKERVLDLVKKGILSSEEALVLLENIATEKDEKQIEKVSDQINSINTTMNKKQKDDVSELLNDLENQAEKDDLFESKSAEEAFKKKEKKEHEQLEKILSDLAEEANRASVGLDKVVIEVQEIKGKIKKYEEQLMELDTKEELEASQEEDASKRKVLNEKINKLEETLAEKIQKKVKLEAELKSIRKDQWSGTKERVVSKFDIPEDWKEQASDTVNQVNDKMTEAGIQLGSFFKKTINSFAETMNDNMEWKDINFKVPGIASTKFDHTFNYPTPKASLIDVKVANGDITFKTWDEDDLKVEGKIKFYGKMNTNVPMEAFLERSQIEVDDELISFQIPNKRIRADLVFYLPKRVYDHVSVKLLNGTISIDGLQAKDVYTKSTNGSIIVDKIEATMLEIQGVNGDIKLISGEILDTIIETVNGTATVTATPKTIGISLVNGDVRITATQPTLKKIEANSVNGNVKIALPQSLGLEGTVKTNLGNIHTRLNEYEVVREKKERMNQFLQFRRVSENDIAQIHASTKTGNIYLKDTDK